MREILRRRNDRTSGLPALLAGMGLLGACATPPAPLPQLPASRWGGKFSYSYEPPQKVPAGSVAAPIAVVNPSYKEADSSLSEAAYSKVGRGFSASMGVDMDKVLIAKGMTTLGPFAGLDELTFVDKKNASLTLAPKVFIAHQVKYAGDWFTMKGQDHAGRVQTWSCRKFEMKIGGWISYVMQEPLSGEKMWVKKLELEDKLIHGIEAYGLVPVYTETTGFLGEKERKITGHKRTDQMVFDGKVDALADYLKEMYPTILGKCWTYMDANEILMLKEKTKEIRELKRY